jgi:hypothetical protein
MLKLTFNEPIEGILSLLPSSSAMWAFRGSSNLARMISVARFLSKKRLPKRMKILETPTWNRYRRQVLYLLNKLCGMSSPLAGYYTHDDEEIERSNLETIGHILDQYDILNQGVIHLTLKIGVVEQLTNNKSNMYPNLAQRKRHHNGSLIQHKVSGVQEVEVVPVPVMDNEGILEDIRYCMVGTILSYLMPQGPKLTNKAHKFMHFR